MEKYNTKQKEQMIKLSLQKLSGDDEVDWEDIIDSLGISLHKDTLRRWARGMQIYDEYLKETKHKSVRDDSEKTIKKILELKQQRILLSDEKRYVNERLRELTRVEDFYKKLEDKISSSDPVQLREVEFSDKSNEAVLMLSDWHYGIEVDNKVNKFNSEIANSRVSELAGKVIKHCKINDVSKLNIFCLGDLISSEIHTIIKMENREDLSTQIYEVSELLSKFIETVSKVVPIEVTFTFGNHERTGLKDLSKDSDNFTILIEKYVMLLLRDNENVIINSSETNSDIIYKNIMGNDFVGVHGHQEKRKGVAPDLSAILSGRNVDYVCMGHLHSQCNYIDNTSEVFINGSLCGTDAYAYGKRLFSPPSQKLLIVNDEGVECIYNIKV